MKITLKLIGPLIYPAGFSEKAIVLPVAATVGDAFARAKIEKSRPVIITVNGRAVSFSSVLKDGDRIVISHIYSGG
jgi:sulfur carrier protein ThiS